MNIEPIDTEEITTDLMYFPGELIRFAEKLNEVIKYINTDDRESLRRKVEAILWRTYKTTAASQNMEAVSEEIVNLLLS